MNLSSALIHGSIFALIASLMIMVILKINPRYEMKSYPKEILDCVPPQTKEEKRGFLKLGLPMISVILIYLLVCVVLTYKGTAVSFLTLFLHIYIMCFIWNLVDLFIMDWLIFCYISPKFMALPGTVGHKAYKNYWYHFIGFLKGLVICVAASLVLAIICKLILILL